MFSVDFQYMTIYLYKKECHKESIMNFNVNRKKLRKKQDQIKAHHKTDQIAQKSTVI